MSELVVPDTSLETEFFRYVEGMIDAKGVYPFPAISSLMNGHREVAAITEPGLCFKWFRTQLGNAECIETIVGLDRTTKEGQGTEFADVLTCFHWKRQHPNVLRVGVINYQPEPLIVRPFDWGNEFWRQRVVAEVNRYATPHGLVLELQ